MSAFSGEAITYLSANSLAQETSTTQDHLYPVEFLESLKVSSLPSHKLILKVGTPIMLLRNLHAAEGLCNETRLICQAF